MEALTVNATVNTIVEDTRDEHGIYYDCLTLADTIRWNYPGYDRTLLTPVTPDVVYPQPVINKDEYSISPL